MPTPPKPFEVLRNEKKSHRTKAELKQREQGEKALISGVALRERPEVKNNRIAHKEFKRLNELLKLIKKNDAIYETIINRYCLIVAECTDFETQKESFSNNLFELEKDKENLINDGQMSLSDYYKLQSNLQKNILDIDKQIQQKRKMLLDIEKENIMTIAAALRSIPKKEDKPSGGLREALQGD